MEIAYLSSKNLGIKMIERITLLKREIGAHICISKNRSSNLCCSVNARNLWLVYHTKLRNTRGDRSKFRNRNPFGLFGNGMELSNDNY